MAGLFKVPERAGRSGDSIVAKKSNAKATKSPATVKGGGDLFSQIANMKALVEKTLGHLRDDYMVIQDADVLNDYITACIDNGVISIDTETTGLDPILDDIVGMSIYTPNQKSAYIPIHHRSYITQSYVDNQLSIDILKSAFQRIVDANTSVIMFNACFDIRVIQNHIGVKLTCTWDCFLAARLLNENEGLRNNGLKKLHQKYVLKDKEDEFKFDQFFNNIQFDLVPIQTAYLYAAHDAIITYELYDYQRQYIYYEPECTSDDRNGMNGVSWVFFNIEMPCVSVVADMENTGVAFDNAYAEKLHEKYHAELEAKKSAVYAIIDTYSASINTYKQRNPAHKLSDPINIDSPAQIATLLYDIIGVEPVDDYSPRGTGEEILVKIDNPVCKAILDYRGVGKLINTYIDKLPSCVNPKDKRIHCKFNQYGADTGRFSSQDPNLQNIPSHNKDIRKMFVATPGYVMMSADYSQQEPKVMSQLCGDEKMLDAYRHGKDLYAEIASLSFNTTYNECLEHFPAGSYIKEVKGKWYYATQDDYDKIADGKTDVYADGKNRRGQAKSILLGVLYGRGIPSIAEQLHTTAQKAQTIKDSVFKGFPAIKNFEADSLAMAKELGYVTTLWGRKRRLPVLQKPDYEFSWVNGSAPDNDPLDFSDTPVILEVPDDIQAKYLRQLKKVYFSQRRKIIDQAKKDGINIVDNTKDKQDTTRQVVNARIQGSAADMSKLAMILIGNDERLRELGFRLLIPVHDELIAECPKENAKECSERFAYLMSTAADRLTIPISCDVEITDRWYGEEVEIE